MEEPKPTKYKVSQHESYNTFTLIAFLLPPLGLLLGVMYLAKDKHEDKKLGEHCIAFSIFTGGIWWVLWSVWLYQFFTPVYFYPY